MPIRYVADMEASARFYTALGLAAGDGSRSGNWAELGASGGMLALHTARSSAADRPGHVELSFEADEPLEAIAGRLASAGFEAEAIVDENFGRSLRVTDPDGVPVQVNEHDRTIYT
jgi:catechol 2,3-dioxygenase-like lactoylglutathione lyase family enzyme